MWLHWETKSNSRTFWFNCSRIPKYWKFLIQLGGAFLQNGLRHSWTIDELPLALRNFWMFNQRIFTTIWSFKNVLKLSSQPSRNSPWVSWSITSWAINWVNMNKFPIGKTGLCVNPSCTTQPWTRSFWSSFTISFTSNGITWGNSKLWRSWSMKTFWPKWSRKNGTCPNKKKPKRRKIKRIIWNGDWSKPRSKRNKMTFRKKSIAWKSKNDLNV